MMRILTTIFVVSLLIASCGSGTSPKPEQDSAVKTRVRVDNRNIARMTIYVLKRSERIMLGTVAGHATNTFIIPDFLVGDATPLRLLADPVGTSRNPISEEFDVRPGDTIEMVIRSF